MIYQVCLCYYRKLLHIIDGVHVQDFSNFTVDNFVSSEKIDEILDHFKLREKVVGFEVVHVDTE